MPRPTLILFSEQIYLELTRTLNIPGVDPALTTSRTRTSTARGPALGTRSTSRATHTLGPAPARAAAPTTAGAAAHTPGAPCLAAVGTMATG